jgi:hypothetical protein
MNDSMPGVARENFPQSIETYLGLLRAEILQAQRLRIEAYGAKIVFLGGLYAYALQRHDTLAMLVGPFVAFFFDSVAYGLTYNIQEIGAYICDYLEPALGRALSNEKFIFWETAKRAGRKDWGRAFARIGNYGITLLASLVSFLSAWTCVRLAVKAPLLGSLLLAYSILIWFDWRSRNLSKRVRGRQPANRD